MTFPAFLWLESFDYNSIWAIAGEVWAVKVNWRFDIPSPFDTCRIIEVFPVPVGPYRKTGSFLSRKYLIICE
jgi:hypothetical protein